MIRYLYMFVIFTLTTKLERLLPSFVVRVKITNIIFQIVNAQNKFFLLYLN